MDKVVYKLNKPTPSEEKSELPNFLNSWIVQIGFFVISATLIYSVYKSINITSQKLDILNRAEKEVEELRLNNLALSIEMKNMSTDQYLEKEARDRLNFGGNGEIVFVIPKSSMEVAKDEVKEILSSEYRENMASDSIRVWENFILKGI